jgi:hypothetical protein
MVANYAARKKEQYRNALLLLRTRIFGLRKRAGKIGSSKAIAGTKLKNLTEKRIKKMLIASY